MPDDKKVVVITGASSGMGQAAAVRLARDGARVVLAARREDRLQKVAEQVHQAGGEALVCPTDVCERAAVDALVDQAVEHFGRIDVAFNNAGLMRTGPIEELADEDIAQMIDVNVLAAFRFVKAVVPVMKRQNSGLILNVSSVLGRKTRAKAWVYAGTKWAITAMSEGLREELLGTKIPVCSLQPGAIDTELFDHFEEHPAKWQGITEMLKPTEMAELIAFIVRQPWHFSINEVLIRPTEQSV